MFLAEQYGRMTLTLEQIAEQVGLAPNTIKNRRSRGEFDWLMSDGRKLSADVADLAAFLDQRRQPQVVALDRAWVTVEALTERTQRAGPGRRKRRASKG